MSLTLSDLWSFRWQYSLIVVVSELIAVCMLGLVKSFELSCLLHPVFVFHSVSPKLQMHTLHGRFYMVDVALHDIFYMVDVVVHGVHLDILIWITSVFLVIYLTSTVYLFFVKTWNFLDQRSEAPMKHLLYVCPFVRSFSPETF